MLRSGKELQEVKTDDGSSELQRHLAEEKLPKTETDCCLPKQTGQTSRQHEGRDSLPKQTEHCLPKQTGQTTKAAEATKKKT